MNHHEGRPGPDYADAYAVHLADQYAAAAAQVTDYIDALNGGATSAALPQTHPIHAALIRRHRAADNAGRLTRCKHLYGATPTVGLWFPAAPGIVYCTSCSRAAVLAHRAVDTAREAGTCDHCQATSRPLADGHLVTGCGTVIIISLICIVCLDGSHPDGGGVA